MAIGVYLTFRILDMPDLSVEGTVILGMAMAGRLIDAGRNPFVATGAAILVGCAGGFVTGVLHTKFKIPPILAGILTMVASWSVVIRILGARPNLPLPPHGARPVVSVYTFLQESAFFQRTFDNPRLAAIIVLTSVIVVVFGALLYCFLGTEVGSAVRATGNNRQMVKAQGINTDTMTILCLMISNGLVGMTGALAAQQQGFADVNMGVGTIVVGLASVIIAEVLFRVRSVWARFISLVVGSIIYRLIIALALRLDFLEASDFRMLIAIIVAIALTLPLIREKLAKFIKKLGRGTR